MTTLRAQRPCRRPAAAAAKAPRRLAVPDGSRARLPALRFGRRGWKARIRPWSRSGWWWWQGLPERPRVESPVRMAAKPVPREATLGQRLALRESCRVSRLSARALRPFGGHRKLQVRLDRGRTYHHGLVRRDASYSAPRRQAASRAARSKQGSSVRILSRPEAARSLTEMAVRRLGAPVASELPEV